MNTEEKLLRENIRKIIQIVQDKKDNERKQALLEENALRKIVRTLLKEDYTSS